MKLFGAKLRHLRRKNGMTQRGLAEMLGFSAQSYINALETGKKQPTVQVIMRLSQIFGATTDSLLFDHLKLPDQEQDISLPPSEAHKAVNQTVSKQR